MGASNDGRVSPTSRTASSHAAHTLPTPECRACTRDARAEILRAGKRLRRCFQWRRPGVDRYELILAEVLLQQTGAQRVAQHIDRILTLCPTWHSLATIDGGILEEALRPLGLQRRRSGALRRLAQAVVELGALPETAEELAVLPGVGQYISRAIVVQLGFEGASPIDGNIARVLERQFGRRQLADFRFDPALQSLAVELFAGDRQPDFFYAILDFAADTCSARDPSCSSCPIKRCHYRSSTLDQAQEARVPIASPSGGGTAFAT